MTVQTNTNSIAYVGNGSTVHFDYDFLILDSAHLKVYFNSVLQTSGYVVSGVGSQSGGTVAFAAAPANGVGINLVRDVPFYQLTDYQPYDAFPADTHERALDLLTMMAQQLKDELGRTLQYPVGGSKWDAEGSEIINVAEGAEDTSAANVGQVKSLITELAGPDSAAQLRAELASSSGFGLIGSMSYSGIRGYTGPLTTLRCYGRSNIFDQAEGIFVLDEADVTGADNDVTILVDSIGRRWKRVFEGEIKATWAGVSESNADNADAIMNALAVAGSKPVRLPSGTLLSGKITFGSYITLLGNGSESTTLRLKNGANTDLLYAQNSDALWGTNSDVCAISPRIEGMKIDGNRANNTSGTGLAMYAERPILRDLYILGCASDGLRTEWSGTEHGTMTGVEGHFTDLVIALNGGHGWRFAGPHDSHVDNVIIHSNSLKADRVYQNLWLEKSNARWSRIHSYSLSDALPLRVQHSLLVSIGASGNEFTMSHFEGAATNVRVVGNNNVFDETCRYYYPWDGVNIAVGGQGNVIRGLLSEEYPGIGLPRTKGLIFSGDAGGASGNDIDIVCSGCGGGAIDFNATAGSNKVVVRGYSPLGTDLGYVGIPHATDEVDVYVKGGQAQSLRRSFGYYNRQVANIAGAGSVQSDATAMSVGVVVFNLNAGGVGSGIRLPNTSLVGNGAEITVTNTTATSIKIYPNTGGNIAGLGLNNPLALAGLKTARLTVIDSAAGQWAAMVG